MRLISIDTETTGLDLYHRDVPFLVTTCNTNMDNTYFEWAVHPKHRSVSPPARDIEELVDIIDRADKIVMHNSKFDVTALLKVLPKDYRWPWHKTEDTLIAGHLLASNHPHTLSSMVLEYLNILIDKHEDQLANNVKQCRALIDREGCPVGDWTVARKGMPGMPSLKEKIWKSDYWLPRAMVLHARKNFTFRQWLEMLMVSREDLQHWEQDTAIYANHDSAATLALYQRLMTLVEGRGLMAIYKDRTTILGPVHETEQNGITVSSPRLDKLTQKYREGSDRLKQVCLTVAKDYGYELKLPKSGNNKSLHKFVFGVLNLPVVSRSDKTGQPSLDKLVLEEYVATLPSTSKRAIFIKSLRKIRKWATAISYMDSYDKFWLPTEHSDKGWYRLHPSLNPTATDTLRFSSSNPNEQNISKQQGFNLRYLFGPTPGREWWSLDYSNIELRIPAYEAGEAELVELFERRGDPPYFGSTHLLNFHTVYPDIWDKERKQVGNNRVGPHCKKKYAASYYQWAKNGGFAVQYGSIEESGTADRAFHRPGAFAKIKQRFTKIHGPGGLNEQMIDHANRFGYIETMPDCTADPTRGYPLLCAKDSHGKVLPTVPLNYHTQGTACWVIAKAMVIVQKYLRQLNLIKGGGFFLIMQIHDEIVLDFPRADNHGNLPIVRSIQQLISGLGQNLIPKVSLPVGVEYHPVCWSEGETI